MLYFMHHLNLSVFMVNLVNEGIVKKKLIVENYKFSFEMGLYGHAHLGFDIPEFNELQAHKNFSLD